MSLFTDVNGGSTIRLFKAALVFNVSWFSTRLRFSSVILVLNPCSVDANEGLKQCFYTHRLTVSPCPKLFRPVPDCHCLCNYCNYLK